MAESCSNARTEQDRMMKIMLKYNPQNEIAVNPVSELATPHAFTGGFPAGCAQARAVYSGAGGPAEQGEVLSQ